MTVYYITLSVLAVILISLLAWGTGRYGFGWLLGERDTK